MGSYLAINVLGGYADSGKFLKDKALRVLLPYFIIGLSLVFLQHREIRQMLYGISHLWFLISIFECYLLGKVVERVLWLDDKQRKLMISLSVLFLVLLSYRIPLPSILCMNRFVVYFPYYLIGMLVDGIDFSVFSKYRNVILAGICVLLLGFAFQQIYFGRYIATVTIGVTIVLLMFTYFRTLRILKLPSWIISLDNCSMGVYIIHHILIQEINTIPLFHGLAVEHYYVYPIAQFFLVLLLSWQFVALCKMNKYAKYILG